MAAISPQPQHILRWYNPVKLYICLFPHHPCVPEAAMKTIEHQEEYTPLPLKV